MLLRQQYLHTAKTYPEAGVFGELRFDCGVLSMRESNLGLCTSGPDVIASCFFTADTLECTDKQHVYKQTVIVSLCWKINIYLDVSK